MFLALLDILNLLQILHSGLEFQQKNHEISNNVLKALECFVAQWTFGDKMGRIQIIYLCNM